MKTEYIGVSKNDSFLDMLADKLPYLESAEVFISNDLMAKLIKSCTDVHHPNNNTYILVWRSDLPYEQSISVCLDSKSKWQKISTINILNKVLKGNVDNPKYKLYFLCK